MDISLALSISFHFVSKPKKGAVTDKSSSKTKKIHPIP